MTNLHNQPFDIRYIDLSPLFLDALAELLGPHHGQVQSAGLSLADRSFCTIWTAISNAASCSLAGLNAALNTCKAPTEQSIPASSAAILKISQICLDQKSELDRPQYIVYAYQLSTDSYASSLRNEKTWCAFSPLEQRIPQSRQTWSSNFSVPQRCKTSRVRLAVQSG